MMNIEEKQVMKELTDMLSDTWYSLVDEWSKHSSYDAKDDTKKIQSLLEKGWKLSDV